MKTATVTAYINTGFSGINVPDSPDILENNAIKKQLNVINCLPLSGQVNVSIRVKDYPELHETDYIKMEFSGDNTTYWAKVNGYVYLSSTVEISLTMDYWLTLGGIDNISSISGITKRVHVAKADDTLFAYTEPDEMINPARPLKTVCEEYDASILNSSYDPEDTPDNPFQNNVSVTVVLSTLDLYAIGRIYCDELVRVDDNNDPLETAKVLEGLHTYVDPDTQQTVTETKTVTIPKLFNIGDVDYHDFETVWSITQSDMEFLDDYPYGKVQMAVPKPTQGDWYEEDVVDLRLPKVGYFDASDPWVQKGISIVHDCGVEDCLLDQYRIPAMYLLQGYGSCYGRAILLAAHDSSGIIGSTSLMNYEYGTYTARNKKLYSGSCNCYTIYAKANADMQSFNPEVLYMSDLSPEFRMCSDLRHQGGSMMSPLAINGDVERWYMNFVREMPFQAVPIKFDGASGSRVSDALMALNLNTNRANYQQLYPNDGMSISEDEGFLSGVLGSGGSTIAGIIELAAGLGITIGTSGLGTAVGAGLMAAGAGSIIGGGSDLIYSGTKGLSNRETTRSTRRAAYDAQVLEEKKGLAIRNTYVAPQIKFQQSQTLRELVGNGFIIFKYQMSDEDLERCDKLLTMYGYAHVKSLEKTDLTNRPAFNYVEAGEVHITTSVAVPKWVREGAEDQLIGARIWHQMYNDSEYEDNE